MSSAVSAVSRISLCLTSKRPCGRAWRLWHGTTALGFTGRDSKTMAPTESARRFYAGFIVRSARVNWHPFARPRRSTAFKRQPAFSLTPALRVNKS